MPRHSSARTLLTAATLTAMLATGAALAACSPTPSSNASAPSPQASDPSPSASAAGLISPQNADEFGLPAGDGAVRIELWTDLSCPYCQKLEAATGDMISDAVAAGRATLVIHPMNFVSAKHGDQTDWSTRAANALAAVTNAGENDRLPALYALLQEHQTLADGSSHPTDDDLLGFIREAGVTTDLTNAVTTRPFAAWVSASNDHWMGSTIAGTSQVVQGVPILVIDGRVVDLSAADAIDQVRTAIGG